MIPEDYVPRRWILLEVTPREALEIPTRACLDLLLLQSSEAVLGVMRKHGTYNPDKMIFSDVEQQVMGHNVYPTGPLLKLTAPYGGAQEGALAFASLELMGEEEPRLLLYLEITEG